MSGAGDIIAGTIKAGTAPAGIGAAMAGTEAMAGVAPWVGMVGLARAAMGVIAAVQNSTAVAARDTMAAAVMVGPDTTAAVMSPAMGVDMVAVVATTARR